MVFEDQHYYYKLYKPYGYLSQFVNNQKRRRNKRLLSEWKNLPQGIMAVGRLDEKSEGLLLLTTDGKFSDRVRDKTIEKEYHVMVDGVVTKTAINQLQNSVTISVDGKPYQTMPCKAHLLDDVSHIKERFVRDPRHGETSWLSITLREGKYKQVRKMTATVGFPTLRLVRVRIGDFHLGSMEFGELVAINSLQI
ncbi:MAG: pseudouridine synthase [Winogradskyella sp.]|nr:pseudouridine synthase [Winogradskyella sp.]MBT8376269.1 pseudouridine synthase [Bacteroidia bacterium]NNC44618.1 pseudouridine synthase [Winogradskyella sp.]NNF85633.1 pseudouridine synthase [Winogradskyella sp.]NNL83173.1 pseudouridine synthase [Winogradskyella sp.]